jgi:Holliday junction resolvasome RuvABC endonuclease subunit
MEYPVAGLDLSLTNSGVVLLYPDKKVFRFSYGYSLSKQATQRDHLERVIKISNQIMKFLRVEPPKVVGIENYAFSGQQLTRQADLGGCVKAQIYAAFGVMPVALASTTVRSFLIGEVPKGEKVNNRSKDVAERTLREKGFEGPTNHDEWDALAVAYVMDAWANRRDECDNKQLKIIKRIDYEIGRQG